MFCFACVHLLLFLKFPFELLQVPGEFFTTARIYGIFQPSQGGSFHCVVSLISRVSQRNVTRWHISWDLFKKGQEDDHTNIRRLTFFCAWDLSFLYLILDFWSMSNSQVDCYFSQSCLHHCVFVGTFRFPGRFVSWWDFFSSGFVWAVCSFNNFCRGKVWGSVVSVGTWKHMVFLYSPLFCCSVGERFFFRQGRYFLQRRSEFHAFRIAWPTGLLGRVEVVEDFSRDTSPIFFPLKRLTWMWLKLLFWDFFVEQKVLAQESSRRKNLQRHSLCNCRRQPFG